ncbi:MAG: Ig-like domain-containing protein [Halioglobus sp.]|nr:Ig-like domain-containing protein [Halioglobus sp.]
MIDFVDVVAPNAAVGSITVDGVPIPAGDFSPIGASGFSGAQVDVSVGSHTVDGPLPFGITVYGFATADSYELSRAAWPWARWRELVKVQPSPATATNPVNTEHCVTATTLDQDSDPLQGILVNFTVSGANTDSGFGSTDAQGTIEFCYTGTNTGTDTRVVATAGNNISAQAEKIWQQSGGGGGLAACDGDDDGVISRMDVWMIAIFRGTEVDSGSQRRQSPLRTAWITRRDFKACLQELGTQAIPD